MCVWLRGCSVAYSDYGGYAYRDGERVEERSDCTINPNGDTFGTPGMWPGFATLGLPEEERNKRLRWPGGHAVLGDGPVYVVLYKQTTVRVFRGPEELDVVSLLVEPVPGMWVDYPEYNERFIDHDYFIDNDVPCLLAVDGCRIEIWYRDEDNYYTYAKLTQPDGNVWHGWSGYGVGAGLEDAGYGYSTPEREATMMELWPQDFKG